MRTRTETINVDEIELIEQSNVKHVFNNIIGHEHNILYDFIDQCFLPRRYEEYQYRINVGMGIKNSYGEDGFALFKYFSLKASCHDSEAELRIKYDTFDNNALEKRLSIAILYHYAKEDNEKKFTNLIKKYKMFEEFEMSSAMIVKYIKMLRPNDFIWKNNCLYSYNGKYWEQCDIPMNIIIGISHCSQYLPL